MEEVDNYNGIDDLASLINACDQIVAIENLIPNLAGAIGIHCSVLLNHKSHWRYGENNNSCYWLPSLSLFRKKHDESWDQALKQIQQNMTSSNQTIYTSK